jgi:hypothetical protein
VHERLSDGFLGVSQVKQICPGSEHQQGIAGLFSILYA